MNEALRRRIRAEQPTVSRLVRGLLLLREVHGLSLQDMQQRLRGLKDLHVSRPRTRLRSESQLAAQRGFGAFRFGFGCSARIPRIQRGFRAFWLLSAHSAHRLGFCLMHVREML